MRRSALGGYFALENVTGIDFHIIRRMAVPLSAGIVCAVVSRIVYGFVGESVNAVTALVFADSFGRCGLYNFTDNLQRD